MQKLDGFFPLYWDERTGSLFLEISRFEQDFLYANGLAAGLGSNDIGLDRGQEGGGRLVRFERVGPRILLMQPQESFRSSSTNAAERRSVEDSFAKSVLWGFTSRRKPTAACWWMPPISCCATGTARPIRCVRGRIASIARAARSTWRAPKRFPRTPRSK